jgi:hypothetical protein
MSNILQSGCSKTYLIGPFFNIVRSRFFKKKLHGKTLKKMEHFYIVVERLVHEFS